MAETFRLIAGDDLTYHHSVEVVFEEAMYLACPAEFSHPVFRSASSEETLRVQEGSRW
jgi:hypothetical protein